MVRGWLLRAAPFSSCSRVPEGRRHSIQRDRKRGRGYCPRLPSSCRLRRPFLPPQSARSLPPRSPARATLQGVEQGPCGVGSPLASRAHGLPTTRAPAVPLLFFWSPQNLQFPRFHGPRLVPPLPPPRRFSAMQLQGSLFPRLQIPAPPDSEGRRGRGGWRGARPGEQSRQARAQRQPGRPPLGAEAGGRGGEARPNAAMRTGSGTSGFGAARPPRPSAEPQPLTLPRPGGCCHYRIWGEFPSP